VHTSAKEQQQKQQQRPPFFYPPPPAQRPALPPSHVIIPVNKNWLRAKLVFGTISIVAGSVVLGTGAVAAGLLPDAIFWAWTGMVFSAPFVSTYLGYFVFLPLPVTHQP